MKPPELILEQMEVGPMNNFIYFLGDAKTKDIAIVDPAWEVGYLTERAKKKGYRIVSVFLTHGHPDHVNGLEELLSTHDVPVYLSKQEAPFYTPPHKNIKKVNHQDILTIGNLGFECLHTPGHTPGCQCFKYKDVLITGDTLFIDGCGRCDLPGGNAKALYQSLADVILKLPDSTVIFPGHHYGEVPFATLADQKKTNPYLNSKNIDQFLHKRLGL